MNANDMIETIINALIKRIVAEVKADLNMQDLHDRLKKLEYRADIIEGLQEHDAKNPPVISSGFDGIENKQQLEKFIEDVVTTNVAIEDFVDDRIDRGLRNYDFDELDGKISDYLQNNVTITVDVN